MWALLALCREVSVWLYLAVSAVLCYQLLAARSLQTESMKVYQELKKGDLPGARRAVSMICLLYTSMAGGKSRPLYGIDP